MTLEFPNKCRSFESTKKSIRFWGYDSIVEVTFFIELNAIKKLFPNTDLDEKPLLQAFDRAVVHIHEVATRIYGRNRSHSFVYVLTENDF